MTYGRACKSSKLRYVENSSDMDGDISETETQYGNEQDSSEMESGPYYSQTTYSHSQPTISYGPSSSYTEATYIQESSPPANPVVEMITEFIDYHHSISGRFDQEAISEAHPLPAYPTPFEQLQIAASMVDHFENHPGDIKELDLRNVNEAKPWKDGVPWCQYENICLINEMAHFMATRGESKIGGATLMNEMSKVLNSRYGIGRSAMAVKNQWYRQLRARSGIDERGNFGKARNSDRFSGPLAVSQGGRPKSKVVSGRVGKKTAVFKNK